MVRHNNQIPNQHFRKNWAVRFLLRRLHSLHSGAACAWLAPALAARRSMSQPLLRRPCLSGGPRAGLPAMSHEG